MEKKAIRYRIVEYILKKFAHSVLWRQKPFVIGITGSVGKTTTKDMVACVLRGHKNIHVAQKNHNNEIGVPLTILCFNGSVHNVTHLFGVVRQWVWAMCSRNYPEIVVVEMAVDQPGDMDYLLSIVSPDIAIVTAIAHSHRKFFRSIDAIAREKCAIVTHAQKPPIAIVNADDAHITKVLARHSIVSYGIDDHNAQFRATDVECGAQQNTVCGVSFKLNHHGNVIPVRLPHVVATHYVYAALAALAVADAVHINLLDAAQNLTHVVSSPGRMRLLRGKNGASIIDDTYNASLASITAALHTLKNFPASRRVAVLGDVLELGELCRKHHRDIADVMMACHIDSVVLVGIHVQHTKDALAQQGYDMHRVFCAQSPMDVIAHVQKLLREDTVVLVKGSQGMRMEKIVAEIVHDDTNIATQLCRQDPIWRKKPFVLHDEP